MIPNIPVLPLLADIPYNILVTTTSAPTTLAKSPPADKPVFPPVPPTPDALEFALHRTLRLRASIYSARASADVVCILGRENARADADRARYRRRAPVTADVPPREWVPEQGKLVGDEKGKGRECGPGGDEKGVWVQRATFGSTFRLNCPPSFAVHNIECAVCSCPLQVKRIEAYL